MTLLKTVAIAGMGAIGARVASDLLNDAVPGLSLTAVSARDTEKARRNLGPGGRDVEIISLDALPSKADIIVECLPAAVFDYVAIPAIESGKTLMVLSAGALLDRRHLIERAKKTGATIIVPSGAILALDAVRAAAEGEIKSVTIETRKPPKSLAGAPLVVEKEIDLGALNRATMIFEGTVTEAVRHFPANVNVAAALSLAGIGPERTRIQVWADPGVERNTQTIAVDSECARFEAKIEGVPSPDNPRTGLMTPQSTLAALRRLTSRFIVGT